MKYFICCLIVVCNCSFGASSGTFGSTFKVEEKSLLTLIEERLHGFARDGRLETMEKDFVKRVNDRVSRPVPLGLIRSLKTTIHYYSPDFVLKSPIKDISGNIIAEPQKVNALSRLPYWQPVLVFLNFDDIAERMFAKSIQKQYPKIKWILTGGSIMDAQDFLQERVYFDQSGILCQKLQIKAVPALVTRYKDSLKIQEIAIKEDGHEM